jgi:stage II sporulation protein AA (anti-sigma F factor antagonist)
MRIFRLTELERASGCREIQVEGELDMVVVDQLREALGRIDEEYPQVLVNLERCEFIDSTGIAAIVAAHRSYAEEGRRMVVCGARNQVHRVLSLTGLTTNGLVFQTADEALSVTEIQ